MKHTLRLSLVFALVLVALLVVPAASAGNHTFNGVLAPGGATMPVVLISTPTCTGQGAILVLYDAYKFTVDTDGTYNFGVTSPGTQIHLYLMNAGFTPAAAYSNCLAASNSFPTQFSYALTAGTVYYLVPFDDTLGQAGDSYSATISGPGDICLGGSCTAPEAEAVPGCDVTITIPSTAVGATLTTDTPVYWAPGEMSTETFPAGLTLRALGVDASGAYTKVLYVCGYYWVPTDTIGPNYDAVWNGAPLPTGVVD